MTSQWDDGFVADYTITNPGDTPLANWKIEFDLPANESIVNVWNAEVTHTGTHYVLTPESYNTTIAPDGTADVGFQASTGGDYSPPTNVVINGQPVDDDGGSGDTGGSGDGGSGDTGGGDGGDGGSGDTGGSGGSGDNGLEATYAVTSQWNDGFNGGYTITNPGDTPLANWKIEFDLPANESIVNVWNAEVTHTGTHYVFTPESYNTTIAPDGTADVGFQASTGGDYSPPTNVVINGQPVDDDGGSGSTGGDGGDGDTGGSGDGGSGSTGGGDNGSGDLITQRYGLATVGDYLVQNNAWNNPNGQSIEINPDGGFTIVNEVGSSSTHGAPLAYPSIFMGCHYTNCSPDDVLPMELSDINTVTSSIDYTFPTNGDDIYDASYDIWLNPTYATNGVMQQEIMIWFNHVGPIQPVGHAVSDETIDGKTFTVWEGSNGQSDVVSYVADTPISSWHNFDVLAFIDNTQTYESDMNDSWYLTSIQAGFEPWKDSVGAAIDNFGAAINGKS